MSAAQSDPIDAQLLPLEGLRVVTLATNIPGPVAAAQLREWGCAVVKIEPPDGDLLATAAPAWYAHLHDGVDVVTLDLKAPLGRTMLDGHLAHADLLLTSSRPAALERLGLGWAILHQRFPNLCQVAIVGSPSPFTDKPGHDLTYVAAAGLVSPPALPMTVVGDLAGAANAANTALALLLARARGREASYGQVALDRAALEFARPLLHGLTRPGGLLGGGLPRYALYRSSDGWIALAALEEHFWRRTVQGLSLEIDADYAALASAFVARKGAEWEIWAHDHDLPLVVVATPTFEASQRS